MLYDGVLTTWRPVAGGFERRAISPARAQATSYAAFGTVQPLAQGGAQSDGVTAYVPGTPDVEPGDYLVPRPCADAEPPADAVRVVTVELLTLLGRPHHAEVRAR